MFLKLKSLVHLEILFSVLPIPSQAMRQHACMFQALLTLAFSHAVLTILQKPVQVMSIPNKVAMCTHSMDPFRQKTIMMAQTLLAAVPMLPSLIPIYSKPVMNKLIPKYVKKRSMRLIVRFATQLLSTDQFLWLVMSLPELSTLMKMLTPLL